MPTTAICEPTEISIMPEILTNVTEQEMQPTIAAYRPMLMKLLSLTKFLLSREKRMISTSNAQITVSNEDISPILAASFVFCFMIYPPIAYFTTSSWLASAASIMPEILPSNMTMIRSDMASSSGISDVMMITHFPSATRRSRIL